MERKISMPNFNDLYNLHKISLFYDSFISEKQIKYKILMQKIGNCASNTPISHVKYKLAKMDCLIRSVLSYHL